MGQEEAAHFGRKQLIEHGVRQACILCKEPPE